MKIQYIELVLRALEARHDMSNIDIKTMYKGVKLANFLQEQLKDAQSLASKFVLMHADLNEEGKPKTEIDVTRKPQIVYKSFEDKQECEMRLNELNALEITIPNELKMTQHEIEQFKFTFGELHLLVDLFADE
jgi:hypothetical protein